MKRKIYMIMATLAIILIMTICLVACGNTENKNTENNGRFNNDETILVCIGSGSTLNSLYALYYDKSTKVMYMYVVDYHGAGLTPMYNADGTLKLYEEE